MTTVSVIRSLPQNFGKPTMRLDPTRALEPAKKKLSNIEAQRIVTVLDDCELRMEMTTVIKYAINNLENLQSAISDDIFNLLEIHKEIMERYHKLLSDASDGDSVALTRSDKTRSSIENDVIHSTKNVLRALRNVPNVYRIIKTETSESQKEIRFLLSEFASLKDYLFERLLTTPTEHKERIEYLKHITDREKVNLSAIEKLETALQAAVDDKEEQLKDMNESVRKLHMESHTAQKYSEDQIKKMNFEAEKEQSGNLKNSSGKCGKFQAELTQLKLQFSSMSSEHRDVETQLRKKKYKVESELDNWIQKYDHDMGERQAEYERIDAVYSEEKKQLQELEERFKTLEEEYTQIMEERRIQREIREHEERELQLMIKAATTIQAFWRSFKVRKALKGKKKKGKKGKKDKKGTSTGRGKKKKKKQ